MPAKSLSELPLIEDVRFVLLVIALTAAYIDERPAFAKLSRSRIALKRPQLKAASAVLSIARRSSRDPTPRLCSDDAT
jgi:hypothetical protein